MGSHSHAGMSCLAMRSSRLDRLDRPSHAQDLISPMHAYGMQDLHPHVGGHVGGTPRSRSRSRGCMQSVPGDCPHIHHDDCWSGGVGEQLGVAGEAGRGAAVGSGRGGRETPQSGVEKGHETRVDRFDDWSR